MDRSHSGMKNCKRNGGRDTLIVHDEWTLEHDLEGETRDNWENWPLSLDCKRYIKERFSWQQIIILEGVTEIPEWTFARCYHVKRVIFANTVIKIGRHAFRNCVLLVFVKLSVNLESIGRSAFFRCNLSSVFIPPRCRNIGYHAFSSNKNLEILSVSQDTELGTISKSISGTKLLENSPFKVLSTHANAAARGHYYHLIDTWLKTTNDDEEFELHRVCSSFEPKLEMILKIMKERGGPKLFKVENSHGITPSRYLEENPYAEVTEKEIIEKYTLQMMGEI